MSPEDRIKELEQALLNCADTFADFKKALILLDRPTLAVACGISEQACRAALRTRESQP